MRETLSRRLDTGDTGRINIFTANLAEQLPDFRPLIVSDNFTFSIMTPSSFAKVRQKIDEDPQRAAKLLKLSRSSPASSNIQAEPKDVRLFKIDKRRNMLDQKISEDAKREEIEDTYRIRKVSLFLEPVVTAEFLPEQLQDEAEQLGATDFYHHLGPISLGWTILSSEKGRAAQLRDKVLDKLTDVLPVVHLNGISVNRR